AADGLGDAARASAPCVRQVYIGRGPDLEGRGELAFERKLYAIRRQAEKAIRYSGEPWGEDFYVPSLSSRTLVYKGMLTSEQLEAFYPEILDPEFESALAIVHSRFSTNTFPSWSRAHPYRYICHNGEINTLRANVNWMHARQSLFRSEVFGEDLAKCLPAICPDGSDSAMFDNCVELLHLAGRPLPQAITMMIPEPWSNDPTMSPEKRAYYAFHSCLMEPWDGPASIAFTDGHVVGAVLDRNGLRPSRYYATKDHLVILGSEVGVVELAPERILAKGRLEPGRMLLVDTDEGRIVADEEVKARIAAERPYREWLRRHLVRIADLPKAPAEPELAREEELRGEAAFGYTFEDLRTILAPMARDGVEPVGSMGTDAPLAVLSEKPQLLYNYFKQAFAQVTNPPIDALREEIVTSTLTTLGSERNLLQPEPESCRRIELRTPFLTAGELAKLRGVSEPGFLATTLPILFPAPRPDDPRASDPGRSLERALGDLFRAADVAIARGANILILSDRGFDRRRAPIPALLAVAGLHHHLVREGTRTRVSLVLDSGEPREVHHHALLIGYGCDAIHPYLALEAVRRIVRDGILEGVDEETACENYLKACLKGVVKVISKMGISTIQGYRGAQIFEAIGLSQEVVERYFAGTPSRVGGIGLDVLAEEALARHAQTYAPHAHGTSGPEARGDYQWRAEGERRLFNPETVYLLQKAVRTGDYEVFKEYSARINDRSKSLCTLRGLLELKFAPEPIPLEEVEPVASIVRRFKTGAMSYGSISEEAHETLAIAMNRLGGKSNTGEGGEDPARYRPDPNGDSRSSAIKQVASGRFGVTSEYLVSARELQIKIAQGAKPGEGGQLPGHKVYPWIARVRHATPGVGLISPPPHHDIYSIEDLAQLIYDLKCANPEARVSVKLVAEMGVGTVAAGVAKARADVVLVSGYDGGTGASPLTSIRHAGVPWELGLAETHQTLLLSDLRSRIAIETDGQLKTGRDVVVAALLGAEEFGFATAPLVALGCLLMRVCHLNTCPVGIATQDPELRKRFAGKPEHVENFMRFVAMEVRELMARLGLRTVDEMVGRADRLEPARAIEHWKARGLDLSPILHQPRVPESVGRRCLRSQDHGLDRTLDRKLLLEACKPAIEEGRRVRLTLPIRNLHRAAGTMVGSEITRRYGSKGLPEDTIQVVFKGSAGQSFGAFIPRGMTLVLEGDANDYIGKGLSGGKIIVYPPHGSSFDPAANIIVGNVAFYGATAGEAYVNGVAGERFCVRNSGLRAVVEGVGAHGCEYMTGGRVVVLGRTGRNFAAGMSGGIAYVYDPAAEFPERCNLDMVDLETLEDPEEIDEVRRMVERHFETTKSWRAYEVLTRWEASVVRFVKVYPKDYRRVLEALQRVRESGLDADAATMAAFEANARDLARAGGG
ncbi:MAG: glutamate synthase large subunit, partial [Planctomycetota bacterium]